MGTNLEQALQVAVEAAFAAGAMLRDEFHRPGGPRGSDGHAEVDERAEHAIRARLLAAFPDWPFTGEETGSHGAADGRVRWLVDPNDGTRPYLRGMRGSAVSIALVRDGLPVLGVVYAPLAPDDGGDLFAWAEGGPLTRNGVAVAREPLPRALAAGHVVLVSQAADASPDANARCAAPARYRTMPSIAYRLALVAAGEGEVAVSLNHPVAWDLAGGHALLRAVGGDLVDEGARPIRYVARGGSGQYVFGGASELARELTRRPWATVHQRSAVDPLTGRYPAAELRPGANVCDPELLRRAQGCVLGQLAGDSLGGLVEFQSPRAIQAAYPGGVRDLADGGTWKTLAGQPTDDSELALLLARTLVREGAWRAGPVREAYGEWLASGPFDCGRAIRSALEGAPVEESQANGALMRISPLGVFGHRLDDGAVAELASADAGLTHPNPVCRDASAAFAVAVAHAVRTGDKPDEVHRAALAWARCAGAEPSVVRALVLAEERPPADFTTQQGWVLIALQNAFHRLLHAPTLEEGLVATVMEGGDTDTNAAIAGALLGAVHGREAVPVRWRRALSSCRPLAGTWRPRPRCLWPVDALELAERLLLAGG